MKANNANREEIMEATEKELIKSIADNRDSGQRYAFLLGAGASISSGIDGAGKLAEKWLNEIKRINTTSYEKIVNSKIFNLSKIATFYTQIYKERFQNFPQDGYKEVEELVTGSNINPSFGYTVLAQVLSETRHNVVLTTNFDRLTETALLTYTNKHARVIAHEEMLNVIKVHDQKPSIVKIHRDMQFSPISNSDDIQELAPSWNEIIHSLINQYNIVCIGYGGNDNGLKQVLSHELTKVSQARIYWCYLENDLPDLNHLLPKCEIHLIKIKIRGFDEFMLKLNHALGFEFLANKIAQKSAIQQKSYEEQLTVLQKGTKGTESSDMIKELVAKTWMEVQFEVESIDNIKEKIKLYSEGLVRFPKSSELMGSYAKLTEDISEPEVSKQNYENALALNHHNIITLHNYASFLMRSGEKAYAIKLIKRALQIEPHNIRNCLLFAELLLRTDSPEAAVSFLEKADTPTEDNELKLLIELYKLGLSKNNGKENIELIRNLIKEGYKFPKGRFTGLIEQA